MKGNVTIRIAPGSFSSRKGAAWSRDWADHAALLATRQHTSTASVQERVISPFPEGMLRAIEAGTCPFCGQSGPTQKNGEGRTFKNLGLHTHVAHGISAAELRKLTGLPRICSEDLSDESRSRLLARPDREEMTRKGTAASMAVEVHVETNGTSPEAGAYRIAHAVQMARYASLSAERDPLIAARLAAGDRLMDVAADFGLTPHRVREITRRMGVTPTNEQTNRERRARLEQMRPAAQASSRRRKDQETARRLARFSELGGDWAALVALAREEGVSQKSMRAYLAERGVVLDGRIARHEHRVSE